MKFGYFLSVLVACFCFSVAYAQSAASILPDSGNPAPENLPAASVRVHLKPALIANLPKQVHETSGLVFFSKQLWTINDSGNLPEIIRIDTATGTVLRTVRVANTVNTDWESITQDDSCVYIGDFGNNWGNRTNLHILKITKASLADTAATIVQAQIIGFRYADQLDFTPRLNKNNYDGEAFIYYRDALHLFTKNWADNRTRHYVIPTIPGEYTVAPYETFDAGGLITDASMNEKGNLVLLGYKNTGGRFWNCFCWLFGKCTDDHFFAYTKTRIELGSAMHLGQTEGIFLKDDNTAWISAESIRVGFIKHPARLMQIDFGKYIK